jgi:sugar phosphate isomerase/epimerase
MKLGLFTACLPMLSLEAVAAWAAAAGYDSLEVAAWPLGSPHPHQAGHLKVAGFTEGDASRVRELFTEHNLTLPAITYCENNLHHDEVERNRIQGHLRACIDAAALLDVSAVGTFIGRDIYRSVADNLKLAERHLPPLVEYAAARGVRLVIENCPMEGWHPDGYPANLAYSPELWDWMFELGLYLTYDPSHLLWLGIDPYDALETYLPTGKILHVQAKDIEINERQRTRFGIFGKTVSRQTPEDVGWWRYRVPGRGQLDWNRLIDTLYESEFDGTVAVEHEDPVWSDSEAKIKRGLDIANHTLRPLIFNE